MTANRYRVSVEGDKNVLKLIMVMTAYIKTLNIRKTSELYTLN